MYSPPRQLTQAEIRSAYKIRDLEWFLSLPNPERFADIIAILRESVSGPSGNRDNECLLDDDDDDDDDKDEGYCSS